MPRLNGNIEKEITGKGIDKSIQGPAQSIDKSTGGGAQSRYVS